uniref:ATP binding protein n=1 Tax=Rhizophora mucronata TaxID=61149 RepID=A0A2P2JJJ2_RHIMU
MQRSPKSNCWLCPQASMSHRSSFWSSLLLRRHVSLNSRKSHRNRIKHGSWSLRMPNRSTQWNQQPWPLPQVRFSSSRSRWK